MRLEVCLRALTFTLALAVATPRARAESVVLLSSDPRAAALLAALELELRGYGPLLLLHAAPEGESEGARLASARQLAVAAGATASVWVESAPPERVRVVVYARACRARLSRPPPPCGSWPPKLA